MFTVNYCISILYTVHNDVFVLTNPTKYFKFLRREPLINTVHCIISTVIYSFSSQDYFVEARNPSGFYRYIVVSSNIVLRSFSSSLYYNFRFWIFFTTQECKKELQSSFFYITLEELSQTGLFLINPKSTVNTSVQCKKQKNVKKNISLVFFLYKIDSTLSN